MAMIQRQKRFARPGHEVTIGELLGLVLAPAVRWWQRKTLEARLRSLHGLAAYFEWQAENARRGLADTHKRQAATRSELNTLR
jgi:hypothetical protein